VDQLALLFVLLLGAVVTVPLGERLRLPAPCWWPPRSGSHSRAMLSAARHEVLSARNEPGAAPEVVDRVLRHLDVRSLR
jgi:hypothetical protein